MPSAYPDNAIKVNNEIRAYDALDGLPYIAKRLGSGVVRGGHFITMEKVDGIQLNHLYLIPTKKKFATDDDAVVLASKLIVALSALSARGLFWNDLSAHNLLISKRELYLFDFGETSDVEANDHVVMLSWLLHDLQLGAPLSYAQDVYAAIFSAGADRDTSRRWIFQAPKGFFTPKLQWIYDLVSELGSITELVNLPPKDVKHLKQYAAGTIKLSPSALRGKTKSSITGALGWSDIPTFVSEESLSQAIHEASLNRNALELPTLVSNLANLQTLRSLHHAAATAGSTVAALSSKLSNTETEARTVGERAATEVAALKRQIGPMEASAKALRLQLVNAEANVQTLGEERRGYEANKILWQKRVTDLAATIKTGETELADRLRRIAALETEASTFVEKLSRLKKNNDTLATEISSLRDGSQLQVASWTQRESTLLGEIQALDARASQAVERCTTLLAQQEKTCADAQKVADLSQARETALREQALASDTQAAARETELAALTEQLAALNQANLVAQSKWEEERRAFHDDLEAAKLSLKAEATLAAQRESGFALQVEAVQGRAARTEKYAASLEQQVSRLSDGDARAQRAWDDERHHCEQQIQMMVDRAERSEAYCRLLADENTKKAEQGARERLEWARERTESQKYLESILDRAKRAESYAQSLLDENGRLKIVQAVHARPATQGSNSASGGNA